MKLEHSNYWNWKEKEYRFDIYIAENFDELEDIKQVYALVVNASGDRLLIVRGKNGMWLLPGGSVEQGETPIDTLIREVKEETNRDVDLTTVMPMYYQKSFLKNTSGQWDYIRVEARYSVIVKNDFEFVSDPDNGDIVEARWVSVDNLGEYLNWGETVVMIKKILKKRFAK